MFRTVPSAPVAEIATEAALVVCQVNVTAWPVTMLLLLAEKTRVGAVGVGGGVTDLDEPEPQPVKAMSSEIAVNSSRSCELDARRPILLNVNDEICPAWLLLRILPPPLGLTDCNVFLLKGRIW